MSKTTDNLQFFGIIIATLLILSVPVVFYGTIFYVVVHFIKKLW